MITIGSTRKPTQRIRRFVKELNWVIPGSIRMTRGKQGFAEFCEAAYDQGATRILLVGAFHGNPGRLGFLEHTGETWQFIPPTVIVTSVQLLREDSKSLPRKPTRLYILPDTSHELAKAELLAHALQAPCVQRDAIGGLPHGSILVLVKLTRPKTIAFITPDEQHLLGPTLSIKHFLPRPMGEQKRW